MKRVLAASALGAGLVLAGGGAQAQSIIRNPGQHDHSIEVEVHGIAHWFYDHGFGAGVRIGIPVMNNGFVPSINNDVRINFGADLLWWGARGYDLVTIIAPVMLQWNFYLHTRWSIFAEAGFAPEFYIDYNNNGCGGRCNGRAFFPWPGTAFGFRFHFRPGDYPTLTVRVGFPTGLNVGVSF